MTTFVSFSGGLDSTVALAWALQNTTGPWVAVGFDYGQRHVRELQHGRQVCTELGVRHACVNLQGMLHGSSLLHDGAVPHGHYAEDSMKATVVQGRNLLFVSALVAATQPGDTVVIGVHSGDHFIYPDCRPDFVDPLTVAVAHAYDVQLLAPFVQLSKAGIAKLGAELGAPVQLSWSCYEGGDVHCGRCGTCVERAEAFAEAGVDDPTTYADPSYWRQAVARAKGTA